MLHFSNRNVNLLLCRFVSLEKTACQGSCQHTSCSSCLLLKPPSCPQTCAHSDSSCLRHFGKCVHNHLTATQNPVCHSNLQVGVRKAPEAGLNCLKTLRPLIQHCAVCLFSLYRAILRGIFCVWSLPVQKHRSNPIM